MPEFLERPRIDILKMSRREVAAIAILGRSGLSKAEIFPIATIVDEAIRAQFPDETESHRPPMVTDLARRLGDPRPYIAASRLWLLYKTRRQEEAADSTDEDGAEEPVVSRVPRER